MDGSSKEFVETILKIGAKQHAQKKEIFKNI